MASSLCSLDAMVQRSKIPLDQRDNAEVEMIMLFDHEEIGSQSAQGADSNMVVESTQRIFNGLHNSCQGLRPGEFMWESYYSAIHRSFLLSADMAHAVHPNYPEKHHSQHMPMLQKGIVLKINAN